MYESFFGMTNTPFGRDIPAERLFESDAFRETLGRLCYVADRQMFAVVTADPGCGKSTLIRRFYSELPKEEYIILYLSDSKLTPRWFYKGMLDQLGLEARFYRGDSKRQLQQQIEIIHGVQHKKVVCVLDEAHLLEKETLEEFRFLLNYKFDSVSPMAVVLVGQTELWDNKLKLQRYAAIRQRRRARGADRTVGQQAETSAVCGDPPADRYVLYTPTSGPGRDRTVCQKPYGLCGMQPGDLYNQSNGRNP